MRCILLILLMAISISASAQKVVDAESGELMVGAVVQLLDSKYMTLDYTITNDRGEFKTFEKKGVWLKFSFLNYRADTVEVSKLPKIIKLEPEKLQLKEVVVTAPKINLRGDTLSYNVASFADETDRSIADVLKKMPGIEVGENGQIRYNGESINKFYIEGADMMDSRYGIATNSISSRDVAAVEVMENHQAIKALDGVSFSDKAAINLKLKENAKATWTGYAELGGGYPSLYSADLAAMSFGKKFQSINTLKANNAGLDITSESASTSLDELLATRDSGGDIANYISIAPGQVLDVDTHFGNNEALSSNFLSKLSGTSDIKGSITLTNSHFNYQQEQVTNYFLQDSIIKVTENEMANAHTRKASANFTYTQNAKNFYLRNTLKGDLEFEDIGLITTGTYPNSQAGFINLQSYSNNFELIKRIGKSSLNISSYNVYSSKPQELIVIDDFTEDINANLFSSHTKASYGFRAGNWSIFAGGGVNYFSQNINQNDFSYTKLYLFPRAEYRSRKGFLFTINAPMSYYIGEEIFMPSLSTYAKFPLSARWTLTVNIGLSKDQISNSNFYDGAIRSNYRIINYGLTEFLPIKNFYSSLGFAYKDPLSLFFMNGSAQYSKSINPFIRSQEFEGEYLISKYINNSSESSSISATFNMGKGYRGGRVSLGLNYAKINGESIQNGIRLPYLLDQVGTDLQANMKFTSWFSAEYLGKFFVNTIDKWTNISWSLNQSANLIFSPIQRLNIVAGGDYLITGNSELFLLGAEAQWKINKTWELSLEATNLVGESHYLVEHLSGTEFISTEYLIRPRSILAKVLIRF